MSTPAAQSRFSLAAILTACVAYGIGMGLTLPLLSIVLERMGEPGSVNGLNLATAGLASITVAPTCRARWQGSARPKCWRWRLPSQRAR